MDKGLPDLPLWRVERTERGGAGGQGRWRQEPESVAAREYADDPGGAVQTLPNRRKMAVLPRLVSPEPNLEEGNLFFSRPIEADAPCALGCQERFPRPAGRFEERGNCRPGMTDRFESRSSGCRNPDRGGR